MTEPLRNERLEKARLEVAAVVEQTHTAMHRALDAKYNLLRVSERRWRIVRVASVATIMFGTPDVITFEQVTKPLAYGAALEELKRYRSK